MIDTQLNLVMIGGNCKRKSAAKTGYHPEQLSIGALPGIAGKEEARHGKYLKNPPGVAFSREDFEMDF